MAESQYISQIYKIRFMSSKSNLEKNPLPTAVQLLFLTKELISFVAQFVVLFPLPFEPLGFNSG